LAQIISVVIGAYLNLIARSQGLINKCVGLMMGCGDTYPAYLYILQYATIGLGLLGIIHIFYISSKTLTWKNVLPAIIPLLLLIALIILDARFSISSPQYPL